MDIFTFHLLLKLSLTFYLLISLTTQALFFLNQVAFRAFHHIALTAEFDALRITESCSTNSHCDSNGNVRKYEWDFGESDAPLIVSGELCCHKDISLQRINIALKVILLLSIGNIH